MKNKTLLAIPKKGRLYESTVQYLQKAGIFFKKDKRSDVTHSTSFPDIMLFFLPAKDIAQYVGKGEVDIGITGQDVVQESKVVVNERLVFDFHTCCLALQVPKGKYKQVTDLQQKKIVTSFPNLAKKYFQERQIEVEIRTVSGSVEVACKLGLADAVIDLVETGETMYAAGLEKLEDVMISRPTLIVNPNSTKQQTTNLICSRLEGAAIADRYMLIEYNIKKNNRMLGEQITPGRTSPTVLPLEDQDWVAIKAMVAKADGHQIMDQLKRIGARDILLYAINNCRM